MMAQGLRESIEGHPATAISTLMRAVAVLEAADRTTLLPDTPGEPRADNAVDRKPVLLELQQRRAEIELDRTTCRPVRGSPETVGPRMEQRDPERRALRRVAGHLVGQTEQLLAAVPERHTEHTERRQEDRLELACRVGKPDGLVPRMCGDLD